MVLKAYYKHSGEIGISETNLLIVGLVGETIIANKMAICVLRFLPGPVGLNRIRSKKSLICRSGARGIQVLKVVSIIASLHQQILIPYVISPTEPGRRAFGKGQFRNLRFLEAVKILYMSKFDTEKGCLVRTG
jgi:hypothetical protein